ncbi:MAG: magnesium chelatase [Candidatus Zambryskibacteria bacterium RIFCSPLOWO2_02_FULL_51_21]|uniref:Magnesium chelatase n=1 Tax=Candidatus Zambryskibacteria bacterium RIFCSPHIGHO2_02_FULL_43_37 TaxID=1802749 RepID=A0A1G2TGE6_9BACT|nr:MAG: magnesium chelatase [Candidatus Zambryskibacteria bacterium RIFCSPHIGHO2_01_FULL_52_18]OHA96364.1 MAG: magnesium chelatase [Candidatus Zambryskibacteria bacterium RIFCSPHIGHO2_02_FULL_43_37]OHB07765.1 MAG: magnesium chelatase [Candidatus Zambryskibacteria bacterium RIFCSPLOWO2_01_FULL_52_12]OHB11377.1 MAG: magnesium chelatase [Candidatus Zambryskibacteria bacterium RIFCSPLOWO2_02_FULL_51_21]
MSFSKVYSAQTQLLNVTPISVETDITRGSLFAFAIVGLPDKSVEEARDRVSAAIKNSGFKSPKNNNHKIVISLAPASLEKQGASFDVAIALSYLLANDEINFDPEKKIFLGELSLDGKVRPVRGVLPVARFAREKGFKELYVPVENAREAALIDDILVYGVRDLRTLIEHLTGEKTLDAEEKTLLDESVVITPTDFADVRGQERAKRGLLIAAAGGHNVAMYGPPGTGKTMLAKAFAGILPKLTFDEALEATGIHSVAGTLQETFITNPPFRSPHHTASYVSLVGGGTNPRPGEITLAHRGVLFMDEFPEFERRVIESLRQPLEDKVISVARAKGTAHFPANVLLVAAMNPCPCGNYGFRGKQCICTPSALQRYRRKMSGPIMDRIDIWLEVDRILPHELGSEGRVGDESKSFRTAVEKARKIQSERFKDKKISKNGEMGAKELVLHVKLEKDAEKALNLAAERLGFSPRVYHRMIKVARTIADLEGSDIVKTNHILEAVEYRPKKFDL